MYVYLYVCRSVNERINANVCWFRQALNMIGGARMANVLIVKEQQRQKDEKETNSKWSSLRVENM